jgi:uncharacterized protein (TIGR03086 family)
MNENTVEDWPALLANSHAALRAAVAAVSTEDWHRPTPCDQWTVTQVLQHAAGDQIAYAAAITGKGWPQEDPFAPSGQLSGDPRTIVDDALAASAGAWATVGQDADQVPVPLPQGPMPAWLGAGACALDAAIHAWDIATATGQPSPLTPELARPLMIVATAIVEPLRSYGAYAAALEPGDGTDQVADLLRYLGRQPHWAP